MPDRRTFLSLAQLNGGLVDAIQAVHEMLTTTSMTKLQMYSSAWSQQYLYQMGLPPLWQNTTFSDDARIGLRKIISMRSGYQKAYQAALAAGTSPGSVIPDNDGLKTQLENDQQVMEGINFLKKAFAIRDENGDMHDFGIYPYSLHDIAVPPPVSNLVKAGTLTLAVHTMQRIIAAEAKKKARASGQHAPPNYDRVVLQPTTDPDISEYEKATDALESGTSDTAISQAVAGNDPVTDSLMSNYDSVTSVLDH